MSTYSEDSYEAEHSIALNMVKETNSELHVCFDNEEIKEILTCRREIKIQIDHKCYCWTTTLRGNRRAYLNKKPTMIVVKKPKNQTHILVEDAALQICKKYKYSQDRCSHGYLERISPPDEQGICDTFFGS